MTAARDREQRSASAGAARVVVVGAGFGGLAAVRGLARSGMQTKLVDRNVYSTFQPLLYEVATAGLTSSDVAYPARSESRRYRAAFRHGELAGIDPTARQIVLADGAKLGRPAGERMRVRWLALGRAVSCVNAWLSAVGRRGRGRPHHRGCRATALL